jgi:FkbM family methyltransferase
MRNLFNYFHVISRVLSSTFPYSRLSLLKYYIGFLFKSFYARVSKAKSGPYRERLFSFVIFFSSFPEFIQLFEEIFVHEVYRFESESDSPIIMDCGSNIGMSVLYFKTLYPKCRIIAFEPEPTNFSYLEKNIATNNLNDVQCYGVGLSTTPGKADLYRALPSPSLNWMLTKPEGAYEHQQILLDQLSRYVNDIVDLLKIDAEGAELSIIEDLLRTGKVNLVAALIIEHHPRLTGMTRSQLVTQLTACGFHCRIKKSDIIIGTRR